MYNRLKVHKTTECVEDACNMYVHAVVPIAMILDPNILKHYYYIHVYATHIVLFDHYEALSMFLMNHNHCTLGYQSQ